MQNKTYHWEFCISLVVISFIAATFTENGRELLRFQNNLIQEREYWRLLSGHFVHLGWSHFVINSLALVLIWSIYGSVFRFITWLLVFIFICIGISLCLLLFDPELQWYVGLSGVLHGLLVCVLIYLLLLKICDQQNSFLAADSMLLLGVIIKLIFEQFYGAIPFTESGSGGSVIVNAHLYGAILGCICGFFLFKFMSVRTE